MSEQNTREEQLLHDLEALEIFAKFLPDEHRKAFTGRVNGVAERVRELLFPEEENFYYGIVNESLAYGWGDEKSGLQ